MAYKNCIIELHTGARYLNLRITNIDPELETEEYNHHKLQIIPIALFVLGLTVPDTVEQTKDTESLKNAPKDELEEGLHEGKLCSLSAMTIAYITLLYF